MKFALGWLCATGCLVAQEPEVESVQLEKPMRLSRVERIDVDADGRDDLVAVVASEGRRELRIWQRRDQAPQFGGEPRIVKLEKDVVAFAFLGNAPRAQKQILLFTSERAELLAQSADGAVEYQPLFSHRIVWPVAPLSDCLPLEPWTRDLDGDGDLDLVLPEPDGARVVLQQKGEGEAQFSIGAEWRLPPWRSPAELSRGANKGVSARGGRSGFQFEFRDEDESDSDSRERGPLVSVRTRSAVVRIVDLDGDARLDGCAVRNGALWWWRQREEGVFADEPSRIALPLPEDRLPLVDPAFDVQLQRLDSDPRPDLLLTTSATRDGALETRIDVALHGDGADPFATAQPSRLRLSTLAGPPQLADANGDGMTDLLAVTLRTDLLSGIAGDNASLEVQCNVFRGDGRRFVTPALLTETLQLPVKRRRGGGAFVRLLEGRGGPGSLLLHDGDFITMRPLVVSGRKLALSDAAFRVPVADGATALSPSADAGEVIVVSEREIQCVRWR